MAGTGELKTSGAWEVKRRLSIPGLTHQADADKLEQVFSAIGGLKGVAADPVKHRVVVVYDVTKTDYRTLCRILEEQGFPPTNGLWSRMLGNWYQYLDTTGRENAHVPEPPCCSNPRGINSGGKRSH